jgi:hypothetical protein
MGDSAIPPAGIPTDIHIVSNTPAAVFIEKCLILNSSDGIFMKEILSCLTLSKVIDCPPVLQVQKDLAEIK